VRSNAVTALSECHQQPLRKTIFVLLNRVLAMREKVDDWDERSILFDELKIADMEAISQ
jgi:hypothetical protein